LATNGILVPKMIQILRPLQTLVISLDAAGPANDEVRGQGVFAAVERAVIAAGEAQIPVKLNAVLSAGTASELEGLLRFVASHDLALTITSSARDQDRWWRPGFG
jgi:MoaA/NifB/PqqE/SkfB family radical SAM enzyme